MELGLDLEAWWLTLVAAPFIGSFLGVLIVRLPAGEPVGLSRSRCSYCNHVLSGVDLVPLLSWVALRRRCRYCGSALGYFYLNIELAALLVAAWAATETSGWLLWVTCGFGWALLALAVIDAKHLYLPDVMTLPLIPAGLAVVWLVDREALAIHAFSAILGFSVFWLVGYVYRRLRGRDGLGLGDAKLLAAAGAWLSWLGLPGVVMIAAASALLVSLLTAAWKKNLSMTQRMPFGPYLCLGTWLVWLYGPLLLG